MYLQVEKKRFRSYVSCIFIAIFFLLNQCTTSTPHQKKQKFFTNLTEEEQADLNYLFRSIFFENYGVFVLFGSKPLSGMYLFDIPIVEEEQQKWIAAMSKAERAEWEKQIEGHTPFEFERNPYKGWLVWKKLKEQLNMKRYILVAHPEKKLGNYSLMFADIQKVVQSIRDNYTIFREAAGFDFKPQEVALELENPDSLFWKKVFEIDNHVAKGLLFGFGKRNAQLFDQQLKYADLEIDADVPSTTTVELEKGSPSNFTIPFFRTTSLEDEMVQTYTKEKEEIEKIYKDQDLVEVTLQKLAS